ncbi:MFS transporter [Pusillimonas sp. CC-YST705]|uniref:MFS transporter n=1 Tax=Mesopusillimonas faecipullorum TaxID=2755040 RepID=A0ABS8CCS5_9BURK|nr:MFS transporter [Mesopusillimonas faecipullorum]MCB5363846.1 MFS transporter [Mesopusillimonas faecipullorum]
MLTNVSAFFSLYLATLVMVMGTGLFNTYLGLRLAGENVSEVWVGALIAVYYLGLVFGARVSHRAISAVGHIRVYAASAAIGTALVLAQALTADLWLWLAFRFGVGVAMVAQLMVLESWLNEQADNRNRGSVFALYMVFSGLGTVLGQISLTGFSTMNEGPLVLVAICSVLALVPVALTRRLHPAAPQPAPLMPRYYLRRVPMSLATVLGSGMMSGAFYGLAPVYAISQGVSSGQAAIFVAVAVGAGLFAQAPIGWLADRVDRASIIRALTLGLVLFSLPLWGWWHPPYYVLLGMACLFGIVLFPLYPVGVAFANDNVDPDMRVGLSALVLMVYGIGACIGPILVGALMHSAGTGMFFLFMSLCAALLVFYVRPEAVSGEHLSDDAPTQYVAMQETPVPTVVAELDPRVEHTDPT